MVNVRSFSDFFHHHMASNYCFLSIREKGTWEYRYKPLMKLAHAAACDSNIVITDDMSVRDLLNPSYPYLLKDHQWGTVRDMLLYVIETFDTEVWHRGLKMMREVKETLSLERVVKDYHKPMIGKIKKTEGFKKVE